MKIVAKKDIFVKTRMLKGYSQRDLSRLSGLSHAYISLIERSRKSVGPGTAKRLSQLLDKDPEELFDYIH
mgnify:CR=1 FL=1